MEKSYFKNLIKEKLGNVNLIVVSNREPVAHEYVGKKIKSVKSVGGLTIGIEPIMKTLNGTWVAYGSGSADKASSDSSGRIKITSEEENEYYAIKRIFLSKQEINDYYYGYANSVLWPLCHIVYVKPVFNSYQFLAYDEVNKKFAAVIKEEIETLKNNSPETGEGKPENIIWLQDYHLARCAKYLKEYDSKIKVGIFWHIPWPNPEVFSICPEKEALLEGLLSNDLIGFHISYHCQNFLRVCEWELEAQVNWADYTVTYKGHKTKIMPCPISVDFQYLQHLADSEKVENIISDIQNKDEIIEHPYEYLAISVDRLDYTKGIIEKLKAIDRLLENYSELRGKFVFLQFGVPSRVHLDAYKRFNDDINSLSEEINWKYGTGDWYPVVRYFKQLDLETYLAYYRLADLVIVSPLHDGMNLVAKEYISSSANCRGMLVLSRFAGAAKELLDAVLVNPFNTECFSESIYKALFMDRDEKVRRMEKMQNIIKENDIYDWAYNFLFALNMV